LNKAVCKPQPAFALFAAEQHGLQISGRDLRGRELASGVWCLYGPIFFSLFVFYPCFLFSSFNLIRFFLPFFFFFPEQIIQQRTSNKQKKKRKRKRRRRRRRID
jgi:hypothetical protein